MAENPESAETLPELTLQEKPQILKWLGGIWFRPRATLQRILAYEKAAWLVPLLILTGLHLIKSLVEGPVRSAAAQAVLMQQMLEMNSGMGDMGMNGGTVGADPSAMTSNFSTGALSTVILPALAGIASIWLVWILFGSMLHLSLTLAGNRNNATTSLNLMAWASLPIAVRLLVQIVATLVTSQLISSPGLSGFIDTSTGTGASFAANMVGNLDLFLIWQLALLVVGGTVMGNISRGKAIMSVIICALVVLALKAVPGTISTMLSGLATGSSFYF